MKRKLKNAICPILLLSLVSCGGGNNPSASQPASEIQNSSAESNQTLASSVQTPVSERPTDEMLGETDLDSFVSYENGMKMGGMEAADPFVFRYNGWYYLYPTTNGGSVRGYKSQDMYNWEKVDNGVNPSGLVYQYSTDGGAAPSASTPFAPEVTYFNGKFYMVFSPLGTGHYFLEADSPEGPFNCITGNLGNSIDGSFFITSDENILMFGAGGSCIQGYKVRDDFTGFDTNDDGGSFQIPIGNASMGGWTEGPYLLQRYGQYYLTYTGNNYVNRDYRVDYAYAPKDSNPISGSSYNYQKTVTLSTTDEFWGLGHSCTVLGPNLDSYYMVYHNMIPGRTRYVNFSRLSFDGANMELNDQRLYDCIGEDMPDFYVDDGSEFTSQGGFLLSDTSSSDTFTVEFNTTGEGKMIFDYLNDTDYSYLSFKDNCLEVRQVSSGLDSIIGEAELIHEFDTEVNHTYRLQYSDGSLALYFDTMEKLLLDDVSFHGGKMGFEAGHQFSEIGFCAYSNVAFGNSDSLYYADRVSFAKNYDERLSYLSPESHLEYLTKDNVPYVMGYTNNLILKTEGDMATYRMMTHEEKGSYDIEMRIPAKYVSSTFDIRIDGGEVRKVTLNGKAPKRNTGDTLVTILEGVELDYGAHNISIVCDGTEIGFSELHYESSVVNEEKDLTFNSSSVDMSGYKVRNDLNLSSTGAATDGQNSVGFVTENAYHNATVEADIALNGIQSDGYVGVLINVKNFSNEEDGTPCQVYNYTGFLFGIKAGKATVEYQNFSHSEKVGGGSFNFEEGDIAFLRVTQEDNVYSFYINEELICTYVANIGNLNGSVGLFAHNADASFLTFAVYD